MSKEELEKAIENGESVWVVVNNIISKKSLDKNWVYIEDNILKWSSVVNKLLGHRYFELNEIYKTKAEAEHYLNHANITRTETLPFLTWEEFNEIGKINFYDKNHCYVEFFINRIEKPYMIRIINHGDSYNCWGIKDYDYNEENFYKACDECVKLYMGGVEE